MNCLGLSITAVFLYLLSSQEYSDRNATCYESEIDAIETDLESDNGYEADSDETREHESSVEFEVMMSKFHGLFFNSKLM